ncbi:MAG: protoporphyrinogen oxidase [Puniceicoccaceae bacterium]
MVPPPTSQKNFDLIVIGGGPSGLAAAFRASLEGKKVCLIEKGPSCGGSVHTHRSEGFLAEAGPNTLLLSDASLDPLLEAAGLASQSISSRPEAKKRFIVRSGRPVPLPTSPLGLIRTPVLSARAKLRLFGDLILPRTPELSSITPGTYFEKRFGREVVDYLLNPFIGGIYAGDPHGLTLRHAFPGLYKIAQSSRSLILGGLGAARQKKKTRQTTARRMVSFPEGLSTLTSTLASRILQHSGCSIQTEATIHSLAGDDSGWTTFLGHRSQLKAPQLILAVPAHAIPNLPFESVAFPALSEAASELRYPPVTSVSLGFPQSSLQAPLTGFGVLVPAIEKRSILGVLYASSIFPNRAPSDHALFTIFVGGRQPEKADLPDQELICTVCGELKDLLGINGPPVWSYIKRWPRAIPQYDQAYDGWIHAVEQIERFHPALKIIGQTRDGISLPCSLLSGWEAGTGW